MSSIPQDVPPKDSVVPLFKCRFCKLQFRSDWRFDLTLRTTIDLIAIHKCGHDTPDSDVNGVADFIGYIPFDSPQVNDFVYSKLSYECDW
jgi:hypothetical protein